MECQRTAQHCQQHILHIAQVVHNGHQNVGKAVRPGSVLKQLFVLLVETSLGFFLVAEHLDDLLSVDHLFNIAVHRTDGVLLLDEERTALAAHELGNHHHHCHKRQDKQRQPDAQTHHCHEYGNHRHDGRKDLRHTLRQHLPERIGVVGVQAHDVAAGMGVEKADGQRLHMGKHLVTDGFQNTLCHHDHEPVIEQRPQNAGGVQHAQSCQRSRQTGEVPAAVQQHGRNVIVDQRLQKCRACHAGNGTDENAHQHQHKLEPILFHIGKQPHKALSCALCSPGHHDATRRRSSLSFLTHCGTLPFCWDS